MVAEKIVVEKTETLNSAIKNSTDQLICKSPKTAPEPDGSLKSLRHEILIKDEQPNHTETSTALYLGVLQILFGLLMAVFGVLVLVHNVSLSQIGGGLWGGCLATLTGVIGVLSAAKDCCPLKSNPQRIALTVFLAMSLVSLAVTNLVLVLAAIGLARDASRTETYTELDNKNIPESTDELLPENYVSLLTGAGLLIVSACECVVAAISAYHSARALCSCFKSDQERDCAECGSTIYAPSHGKEMLVSSWLGKQQTAPSPPLAPPPGMQPVYVVTTNHRKRVKPVAVGPYSMSTPPSSLLSQTMMGYPLIPAPLGATPPKLLRTYPQHPTERVHKKRRRYPSDRQLQQQNISKSQEKPRKQKKSREKQKTITTEEVARTYTGLDRVIAEEFIEFCDSARNTSASGSDSGQCTINSDVAANEYVQKT